MATVNRLNLVKYFNQISVLRKLALIFIVIVVASWVGGFITFFYINTSTGDSIVIKTSAEQSQIIEELVSKSVILRHESVHGTNTTESVEDETSQSDEEDHQHGTEISFADARTSFEENHQALRFGGANSEGQVLASTSNAEIISNWNAVDINWIEFREHILNIETNVENVSDADVDHVIEIHEALLVELHELTDSFETEAESKIALAGVLGYLIPLIITIVASISIFILQRSISRPIIKLATTADELSKGNLTIKVGDDEERKDELGILNDSFKVMVNTFKGVMTKISEVSAMLSTSAQEMASSAEEVNASSEEISSISQQMSQGSQKQIRMVLHSMEQANELKNTLNKELQGIEKASTLIEDITSQVNMLSLNASIEAARAGEYGRGFSVVADSIRVLAEDTKKTVNEVNSNIGQLKISLDTSIDTIRNSIQEIVNISEETAAGAEEASAATEEQAATMEELSASAQELANISTQLESLAAQFKIE